MKKWTTVDADDPIKVGDTLTLNKKDLWRVTNVEGIKCNTKFVDIELIHH